MLSEVIKKGDPGWERLFEAWKSSEEAGWLVLNTEQYRVIANDDDAILFIPVSGNIDSMYGSYTQGVPE
jgi:hypothetical protein